MCISTSYIGYAQLSDNDSKLANHYYNKGEFDKAEVYYVKLFKKYKSKIYFERYFDCLMYQEKFVDAEKEVKKQIKRDALESSYMFSLAELYEKTDRIDEANKVYQELINELPPIQNRVQSLGKTFMSKVKYDYALQTYLKGNKIIKNGYKFNLELADIYSMKSQPREMINEYLNLIDYSYSYVRTVQAYLSRNIDFEDDDKTIEVLREELLIRIQKDPNNEYYSEMLIWLYLQKKEFGGAVIQAKALDKRTGSKGRKVFEIGNVCVTNKSYSNARKAYKYIIEFGNKSPYYNQAIQKNLEVSFLEITEKGSFSKEQVRAVSVDFENALISLGKSNATLKIIDQLATIYAFYIDEPKKAELLVKSSLSLQMTPIQRAKFKVLLGDIFIVDDRIWDASLLYMQVAKEFSEDPIGHEAKYKNAKVFYFEGEFEYAKAQLDVLKASTTKLIANNAMQLSLLIQDNLGVDTTQAPVQMYAKADLLLQQNKFDQAIFQLDSISILYPFHSLIDEVLFKKGEIYEKLQNWNKAIEFYDIVVKSYAFDILGDDAAYRIAKIYDFNLMNESKASDYYKIVLFEFSGSLYTAESRKRFREIRATNPDQDNRLDGNGL
jgi:tetratricopeptide (TPR) repeat protein